MDVFIYIDEQKQWWTAEGFMRGGNISVIEKFPEAIRNETWNDENIFRINGRAPIIVGFDDDGTVLEIPAGNRNVCFN